MKLEHPIVFLFGAGATRGALSEHPIPPPLDNDFFEIAAQIKGHGTPKLAKKVLKDVWTLYGKTNGIGLETYYRDIETREKIGNFAKTRNKPKDWKRRKEDLNELIRRVMIQTTCNTSSSPHTPLISELHRRVLQLATVEDTLVTFNYDVVIEESFENSDLWTPFEGYGIGVHGHRLDWARKWFNTRETSTKKKSHILLLKLHGSLNWMLYANKHVRIKPRPYVTRTNNGNPVRDKVSILPPGWNKQIDKNPYNELWRVTRLNLEKCKSLIIIGYSLPETDLLARALFSEVVRTRVTRKKGVLRQLHLVEPNSIVSQKFVDLFNPTLGSAGVVFKYPNFKDFVTKLSSPLNNKRLLIDG